MLFLTVGFELGEVRPEIADFLFVSDSGEKHLRAGDFRTRVLDVFFKTCCVPDDIGVLVGVRIAVSFDRAGASPFKAVERGADLVGRALSDRMTDNAFLEKSLTRVDIWACTVDALAASARAAMIDF